MKYSISIKEVNKVETDRKTFKTLTMALNYVKKQKKQLSGDEKKITKFRIVQKIKNYGRSI